MNACLLTYLCSSWTLVLLLLVLPLVVVVVKGHQGACSSHGCTLGSEKPCPQ